MASEIKSDKLSPSTGTALQIGDASDTITIPTGATFTITDGLGVAGGGTGLTSFTAGDVLYATGSTTLAKLAKGTAEQVLAMNSGATAPDWGSVDLTVLPTITVAKGGTNLTSFTAGDVLYATGATTLAKLAKGSAADVLTMNTGATAPEWAAAAGGGKIGQIVQTVNTATESIASATFATISDFTVTITPVATSSKILVTSFMNFGTPSTTQCVFLQLFRDTTQIFMGDVASNRIRSTTSNYTAPINNRSWWQASPMYLDSPSTTSAVAYSFKWRGESTATQYLNRTAYDGDEGGSDGVTSYDARTASSITVWEVLA